MGEWLTVEQAIHRDEANNLLPVTVQVEFLDEKPKIKVLPVARGKFLRLNAELKGQETSKDQDKLLITEHCVLPRFTAEQVDQMDLRTSNAIVYAIMSASTGVSQEEIASRPKLSLIEANEEYVKKN